MTATSIFVSPGASETGELGVMTTRAFGCVGRAVTTVVVIEKRGTLNGPALYSKIAGSKAGDKSAPESDRSASEASAEGQCTATSPTGRPSIVPVERSSEHRWRAGAAGKVTSYLSPSATTAGKENGPSGISIGFAPFSRSVAVVSSRPSAVPPTT